MLSLRDYHIISLYKKGISAKDISLQFSCSEGTVFNILKRYKIPARTKRIEITKEIEQIIVEKYLNFESISSISKSLNIPFVKVKNTIENACEVTISYSKRLNRNLVEDFFKSINSPEKAYWLGWLITDGCVYNNAIQLTILKDDIKILNLLSKDLGVHNKVSITTTGYARFYLGCANMVEDLAKYGIVQNKTFSVTIPKMPQRYYSHLLRGMFDGDGGLSIFTRYNHSVFELSFTGNKYCVEAFNDLIHQNLNMDKRTVTRNGSIFRLRWTRRNDIIKILDWLYSDCGEHFLDRKYDKFKKIKGIPR